MAASKGSAVRVSAPLATAAKAPTVARSMLTQGSRRLRPRGEVTAWIVAACAASPPPDAATTRDHIRRSARSLAISIGRSRPIGARKPSWRQAASSSTPAAVMRRRYSTPVAMAQASSWTAVAPAMW